MEAKNTMLFICILTCMMTLFSVGCSMNEMPSQQVNSATVSVIQGEGLHDVPEEDIDTKNKVNTKTEPNKPYKKNDSKIIMKVKNKGTKLNIKIKNEHNYTVTFSESYNLYNYSGGAWEEVECLPNVGIKDIKYVVKKGKSFSQKIDLVDLYGNLDKGKYKIEKEFELKNSIAVVSSRFEI